MGAAAAYTFRRQISTILLFEIWYIDKYITDISFWLFPYVENTVKIRVSKQEVKFLQSAISRATLGRLPAYLHYLENVTSEHISAPAIARALDLSLVCGKGKPKTGYETGALTASLKAALGVNKVTPALLVGAGKLGTALMDYSGFRDYGIEIIAAFDKDEEKIRNVSGKPVYSMEQLRRFCQMHDVKIGIITVPADAAQSVCDQLIASGIEAIWNFSPVMLKIPQGVALQNENLALSLAHLHSMQID